MIVGRILILSIFGCFCRCPAAVAQTTLSSPFLSPASAEQISNMGETVLPITDVKLAKGLAVTFGTGFCLDPMCQFIATNYHVAMVAKPQKIKGDKIIRR